MAKSIIRVFDAGVIGGVLPLFEVEADAVCETEDELEFILYDGAGGCTTVGKIKKRLVRGWIKVTKPMRTHGEWKEIDCNVMGEKTFQCSECVGQAYGYSEPNFCHNCGADMRKRGGGKQ